MIDIVVDSFNYMLHIIWFKYQKTNWIEFDGNEGYKWSMYKLKMENAVKSGEWRKKIKD